MSFSVINVSDSYGAVKFVISVAYDKLKKNKYS